MSAKTVVFDLDDTLALEIDFLHSAFREMAQIVDPCKPELVQLLLNTYYNKGNPFAQLIENYPNFTLDDLVHLYRNHTPTYPPNQSREILEILKSKGCVLGLISDGYAHTQRNKLKALGIENLFDLIVISEEFGSSKPNEANFKIFHQFNSQSYYYIGDNPAKDFLSPNKLGWQTICLLDAGKNIHSQDFNKESLYLPHKNIKNLSELLALIFP